MNREFLLLASDYNPMADVYGWFVSEKFDGMRSLWDGGVTRGMSALDVPWGSEARESTGLWSRYGKVISAPDWWIDNLPKNIILDGELWENYGMFQKIMSTCRKHDPVDSEWATVKYMVFDAPPLSAVLTTGTINNKQMKCDLNPTKTIPAFSSIINKDGAPSFYSTYCNFFPWLLNTYMSNHNDVLHIVKQIRLPTNMGALHETLTGMLNSVLGKGGEGVMLRNPSSLWMPYRDKRLQKLKPSDIGVGTVVNWYWGNGEDAHLLGSLQLKYRDSFFKLSATGMYDNLRQIKYNDELGELWPESFPPKTEVTFKYHGLTDDSQPRTASYVGGAC